MQSASCVSVIAHCQVELVSVTRLRNWVNICIYERKSRDRYSVYSFTNVFTYFNDYLMCRSTGADIGGLKV